MDMLRDAERLVKPAWVLTIVIYWIIQGAGGGDVKIGRRLADTA